VDVLNIVSVYPCIWFLNVFKIDQIHVLITVYLVGSLVWGDMGGIYG